jgi:antitoxin ParD1/3/4
MKMITVYIPETYIETLDLLVNEDLFPNRSEAIRTAIRDLIRNEIILKDLVQKRKIKLENQNE